MRVVATVVLASAGMLEICGIPPTNEVLSGIMPRPEHATSNSVKVGEMTIYPPQAYNLPRREEWINCVKVTGDPPAGGPQLS